MSIMAWPFGALRPLSYGGILADPPWEFETRSERGHGRAPQAHYDCMPLEQIKALPVGHLAAGHCILALWATSPMLPQQLAVMAHWGFAYIGFIAWGKLTSTGKIACGGGYRLRSSAELLLIGRIGEPPINKAVVRNLLLAPRREHSRKPDQVYDELEKLAPLQLYAELFARQHIGRPRWHHWGNQADKYSFAGSAA